MRLLLADLDQAALAGRLSAFMDALDARIPRGLGRGAVWRLHDQSELDQVLGGGARHAIERGSGVAADLVRCGDVGVVDDADPGQVGPRARQRGLDQVGSLGAGNHFLEVQVVERLNAPAIAAAWGCGRVGWR